jgi:Cu(I)/Ag(I) efflux system protein CusF
MKTRNSWLLAMLLALPALAADSIDQAPRASSASPATDEATYHGSAVIKSLDAAKGTVTLSHDPVKALNWPAMTMPFHIDPQLSKGLKAGQRVEFEFTAKGMDGTVRKITARP